MPKVLMTAAEEARQYEREQRLDQLVEQAEQLREAARWHIGKLSQLEDDFEHVFETAMGLAEQANLDRRRRPVRGWPAEWREGIRRLVKGAEK